MKAKVTTKDDHEVLFPKLMCLKIDPKVVVLFFDPLGRFQWDSYDN